MAARITWTLSGLHVSDSNMELDNPAPNKIQLSELFALTGVLSIFFAICSSAGGAILDSLAGAFLISLRLPLTYCARDLSLSIPALLLFLLTPIILEWESLYREWNAVKQPSPLLTWILWSLLYFSYPLLSFFVDLQCSYQATKDRFVRMATDLVLLYVWMFFCVVTLIRMSHK